MGIDLRDRETGDFGFQVNFWNWRPIVELIRSLQVIEDETVESLHNQFVGAGLTKEQARQVATVLRREVLPKLDGAKWVGLDQQEVVERPPGTHGFLEAMQRGDDLSHNYWTNRKVIQDFVEYLETCNGFDVL